MIVIALNITESHPVVISLVTLVTATTNPFIKRYISIKCMNHVYI